MLRSDWTGMETQKLIAEAFIAFLATSDGADVINDKGAIALPTTQTWDDIKDDYTVCSQDNSGVVLKFGGSDSIRDYIAFPKNNSGRDVMIDAPAPIDDEQLAISVIENHLKSFDPFEVVGTFNNPLKAYGTLEKEKVDVIFLDIIMPVYDGFYGLTKIREMNPEAIVIITTSQMSINAQIALNKLNPMVSN